MTIEEELVAVKPATAGHESYVDWSAIFAGIVLAVALALVMLTFGSAIGLSLVKFGASPEVSYVWIAIAAGTWLLWVEVSCAMAGGYLTGRLRRRMHDASEHESDVRDGAHGLIVWAGATIIATLITVSSLGAAESGVASVAQAVSSKAGDASTAYFADLLFRPAPGFIPNSPSGSTSALDAREQAIRVFAQAGITGEVVADDKAFLVQSVVSNTGLSSSDAQARVEQVLKGIDDARATAAAAAEKARKVSVLAAFLTAASLLVAATGAYWAASMGGRHRDEGTVFATIFRRY